MAGDNRQVRTSRCPYCSHRLDAASAVDGSGAAPVPGDYSVCVNCGGFLRFISRLRLARITATHLKGMDSETLAELAHAQRAIFAAKKRAR